MFANGSISDIKEVNFGLPQGSVLGPTLFIFYVNKIAGLLTTAKVKMYADDVVIYTANKNSQVAMKDLQQGLKDLDHHCSELGL